MDELSGIILDEQRKEDDMKQKIKLCMRNCNSNLTQLFYNQDNSSCGCHYNSSAFAPITLSIATYLLYWFAIGLMSRGLKIRRRAALGGHSWPSSGIKILYGMNVIAAIFDPIENYASCIS